MSEQFTGSATKLVRMANQISDFFAAQPGERAAAGVFDHLKAFWTPKMRRDIVDYVNNGGKGLTPLSRQAVDRLRQES